MPRDENDVSVERGEFVTVLNKEDHEWFWIERSDGQEGFVPSAFVYPADVLPGEAFWSRTTADPPRNKRSPGGEWTGDRVTGTGVRATEGRGTGTGVRGTWD